MAVEATSKAVRQGFVDFFAARGHKFMPSASVVAVDDPTLMFINAGMNQFKDIFLGTRKPEYLRAVNSQKCIRVSGKHNDLEEVGKDGYHHTFFEMLGNWSFGDYFKTEAIEWAWELLVDEWGLKPDDLWVGVFGGDEKDGLGRDEESVEIWENHIAVDLIVPSDADDRVCKGAYVMDTATGEIHTILAPVTVLATGGAGKVYLYTSNPDVSTGDGIAMGYRVGARVANMEFFQFHPTILYHPGAKGMLISEALRGEGGVLRDLGGRAFMESYHEAKELAPRDVVARAIDTEMKASGEDHVHLDVSHLDSAFVRERFPNIHSGCLEYGIDITTQPIPVVPAAHYTCGGLVTDLDGRTTVPGLFAVGETACTGLHGANRLASNSLLECLVFAHRAGVAAVDAPRPNYDDVGDWEVGDAVPSDESVVVSQDWDEVRRYMWNYVGIVRSDRRLVRALRRHDLMEEEITEYYWKYLVTSDLLELRNIATVASLIIHSALLRKESRGLHYNSDYPSEDPALAKDTVLSRFASPLAPVGWSPQRSL